MTSQRSTPMSRSGRKRLRSNLSNSVDLLKRQRNPSQFPDEDAVDGILVSQLLRERGVKRATYRDVAEAKAELRRRGLIDPI